MTVNNTLLETPFAALRQTTLLYEKIARLAETRLAQNSLSYLKVF